jgi:hypothetical protein
MLRISPNPFRRFAAILLIFLVVFVPYASAQQPAPVKAPAAPTENLRILVLAGQGEQNDLPRRVMAPLAVQVLDPNDNPVEGAQVTFTFPGSGASALFDDQKSTQTVRTDSGGQARAINWTANTRTGKFEVHVTAILGNQTGQTDVSMYNVNRISEKKPHGWWTKKKVIVVVLVAAAATATGILLSRETGGSGTTRVTISMGTPTLGGP